MIGSAGTQTLLQWDIMCFSEKRHRRQDIATDEWHRIIYVNDDDARTVASGVKELMHPSSLDRSNQVDNVFDRSRNDYCLEDLL